MGASLPQHGELAADDGADVAGGVDRLHLEDVLAGLQLLVGLRRLAPSEGLLVELALEARTGLVRIELELGRGAGRLRLRCLRDPGLRWRAVGRRGEEGRLRRWRWRRRGGRRRWCRRVGRRGRRLTQPGSAATQGLGRGDHRPFRLGRVGRFPLPAAVSGRFPEEAGQLARFDARLAEDADPRPRFGGAACLDLGRSGDFRPFQPVRVPFGAVERPQRDEVDPVAAAVVAADFVAAVFDSEDLDRRIAGVEDRVFGFRGVAADPVAADVDRRGRVDFDTRLASAEDFVAEDLVVWILQNDAGVLAAFNEIALDEAAVGRPLGEDPAGTALERVADDLGADEAVFDADAVFAHPHAVVADLGARQWVAEDFPAGEDTDARRRGARGAAWGAADRIAGDEQVVAVFAVDAIFAAADEVGVAGFRSPDEDAVGAPGEDPVLRVAFVGDVVDRFGPSRIEADVVAVDRGRAAGGRLALTDVACQVDAPAGCGGDHVAAAVAAGAAQRRTGDRRADLAGGPLDVEPDPAEGDDVAIGDGAAADRRLVGARVEEDPGAGAAPVDPVQPDPDPGAGGGEPGALAERP